MSEEEAAEHAAGATLHRNGEIAAHRKVPLRHAMKWWVLAVARILRDVVQPDDPLAAERRAENRGCARMWKLVESILRCARERIQKVRLPRRGIGLVVEEGAELRAGHVRCAIGDRTHDLAAVECGGDRSA